MSEEADKRAQNKLAKTFKMEKELFNVSAVLNVLNKKIIEKKNEESDILKYEEVFFGCEEEFSKYE